MIATRRTLRQQGAIGIGLVLALILAISGCSTVESAGSSGGGSVSNAAAPEASTDPSVVAAKKALDLGYKGDFEPPPTSGPAAVSGKTVWYLSCGQAYLACVMQADAFKDAGAQLGWDVVIQDGKADPSVAAGIIRQGIAAQVDGIALTTFDCPGIKSALLEARTAGVPVVNFGSMDCNDPAFGGTDEPLFTATVKLRGSDNAAEYFREWAKARANYVIATTNGTADALWITEQSQALHQYQGKAFMEQMATCTTCSVTEVPFTFAQVPNPATQQWTTAIQSNPKATVVAEGIDALMGLGLQTAVQQSGRAGLVVGGGEGLPPNFDLIRQGVQTFSVAIPYTWVYWGLADTLNRVFAGQDPATFPNQGAGWQFVDKDHNLPAEGQSYEPPVDYQAAYKAIWSGSPS